MNENSYNVFISYNSKNKQIALSFARQLTDFGLRVWFDAWRLIPGQPWQEAMEKALTASQCIVVLVGEDGFGKWENEEMRVGIEGQISDPTRNVIPVLLPGGNPKSVQERLFLNRNTWVDFRTGLEDKEAMARLISGISRLEPGDIRFDSNDSSSKNQDLTKASSNNEFVPFTNREDELDAIQSSSSAQYHLIHAPSGYGKSRLLQELDNKFGEKDWHHAYASISRYSSLNDVASSLGEKLELNINHQEATRPGLKLGVAFKNYYLGLLNSAKKYVGLVLLIDLDKESSPELLGKILEEFIPDVKRTIDTLVQFKHGSMSFKVIIAGRYLAMTKEVKSTSLPLDQRALTPFTYDVVKKTIDKDFPDHALKEDRHKLAAHIIYMTGGHPACMAKMYLLYKHNPISVDEFIETCKQDVRAIIAFTAEEVRESLPRGSTLFIKALEALMTFRYINNSILDAIREKYQVEVGDTFDFEDILTKNHLYTRTQHILRDTMVRRLISIHLRDFQPDRYVGHCVESRRLCESILQGEDVQSPAAWALESLYQTLQEQSVNGIDTEEQRLNLRSKFFDEALSSTMNLYLQRHVLLNKKKVIEDQKRLISELALSDQWEFEFSVNYFLRKNLYDNTPYKELELKILNFFETKLKELEV